MASDPALNPADSHPRPALEGPPFDSFADAALLLVGHGSTLNRDSSQPVWHLVEAFQLRKSFARVQGGFWKEEPRVGSVLQEIREPRVFVLPFFISEGYFSEEAVPLELGFRREGQPRFERVRQRGDQTLFYCKPVGTHARMTDVILSRAREVLRNHPFPRCPPERLTTLFIVGHGTERNSASRQCVEHQVDLIRRGYDFAAVQAVFMEEEPSVAGCWKRANTRNIVVVPFFLSDGLHVREDIPVLLGQPEAHVQARMAAGQATWRNPTERDGRRIWYTSAVGTDPVVAEVILERVREAATWRR